MKVDFKECKFQVSCSNCYESINAIQEVVAVGITGKPIEAELNRMFRKTELNANNCTKCGSHEVNQCYSYEPKQFEPEIDLPF
jgi:hypothetical protein